MMLAKREETAFQPNSFTQKKVFYFYLKILFHTFQKQSCTENIINYLNNFAMFYQFKPVWQESMCDKNTSFVGMAQNYSNETATVLKEKAIFT